MELLPAKHNHSEEVEALRVPLEWEGAARGKRCNVHAVGGHTADALVGQGTGITGFSLAGLADGAGTVTNSKNVVALFAKRVAKAANGGTVLGFGGKYLRRAVARHRPLGLDYQRCRSGLQASTHFIGGAAVRRAGVIRTVVAAAVDLAVFQVFRVRGNFRNGEPHGSKAEFLRLLCNFFFVDIHKITFCFFVERRFGVKYIIAYFGERARVLRGILSTGEAVFSLLLFLCERLDKFCEKVHNYIKEIWHTGTGLARGLSREYRETGCESPTQKRHCKVYVLSDWHRCAGHSGKTGEGFAERMGFCPTHRVRIFGSDFFTGFPGGAYASA